MTGARHALLVIGGGPAGLAAARGFRDAGATGPVAIVTDEDRTPYERPPLTKDLLRGESSFDDLAIERDTWFAEQRVDLVGGRVVAIDHDRRRATLSGGRELAYETCVLATGSEPMRPPIAGVDRPGVFVVRRPEHVRALLAALGATLGAVCVIGGGFIGCEIAASLRARGHAVEQLIEERVPQAARLGDAAGERLAAWLDDDGVRVVPSFTAQRIEPRGDAFEVVASDGRRVPGALVVLATGARPRLELAAALGLDVGSGAVAVDDRLRARDGLHVAGDAAFAHHRVARRALRVEHWGDALAQGEVAGRAAAGDGDAAWETVPGFWSTIGERTLKYVAWGDGYDAARVEAHVDGAFEVRYRRAGRLVGVLAHGRDAAYDDGRARIAAEAAP